MHSEIEKKLWRKAERYIRVLQVVPFVRMVAVCNNLAFGKVDKKSDIDLFIVAKEGRLFFVRAFVTVLLHILGVRRHGEKVSGRFCLSFFVDDSAMDLSKIAIDNDIYLAYWVKSMVPFLCEDGFSEKFLNMNGWARSYFESESDFNIDNGKVLRVSFFRGFLNRLFAWGFAGFFGDFVERKLKKWQLKRAKAKVKNAGNGSSLIVDDHVLKFHNVDRRREYRGLWVEKYGEGAKLSEERFLRL